MEKHLEAPPKKDFADNLHDYFREVSKTLSGGFVNPLLDIILPSYHQKKFENWCNDVYNALIELEKTTIAKNDLTNNLEFISILKECILIASKNHQDEKHELLKRVIINSIGTSIVFDLKIYFARLIDSLSISHIYILKLINQYIDIIAFKKDFEAIIESFSTDLNSLNVTNEFLYSIFKELHENNLIEMSDNFKFKHSVQYYTVVVAKEKNENLPYLRVTELGKCFIEYIKKY